MRLRLSREALTTLDTDELGLVGGRGPSDDPQPTPPHPISFPVLGCPSVRLCLDTRIDC